MNTAAKSSNYPSRRWAILALLGLLALSIVDHQIWLRAEGDGIHGRLFFFAGLLILVFLGWLTATSRDCQRHGFRRLVSRATFERAGWTVITAFSVICLYYSLELWIGKRMWTRVLDQARTAGEKLDWSAVVPPAVADEENIARIPLFDPLWDLETNALGEVGPRPTPALQKLEWLGLWETRVPSQDPNTSKAPWLGQEFTDLLWWEAFYLDRTHRTYTHYLSQPNLRRQLQATTNTLGTDPGEAPLSPANAARLPVALSVRYGIPRSPDASEQDVLRRLLSSTPQQSAIAILAALREYEPELEALRAESPRRFARFPASPVLASRRPTQTWVWSQLGLILRLRASAQLALGQNDAAFQDVWLRLKFDDYAHQAAVPYYGSLRWEAFLISLQPLWEGLARRAWTSDQLRELQTELSRRNRLADGLRQVRADLFTQIALIEQLIPTSAHKVTGNVAGLTADDEPGLRIVRWFYPRGWSLQNQAALYAYYLDAARPAIDELQRRVFPPADRARDLITASSDPFFPVFLVPKARQATQDYLLHSATAQTFADAARLACALERYRLAHGSIPDSLDSLIPQFINQIPQDVIDGQPMRYRRNADGGFSLYSIGINARDDGGLLAPDRTTESSIDPIHRLDRGGDWVWAQPAGRQANQIR